jgi:site-specific DNA-methyltransferase (adenine-specific)
MTVKINNIKIKKQLNIFRKDEVYKLICDDCIKILNNINDKSVNLVLTDPPYNLGQFMHNRNTNLKRMRENQFAYAGWDDLPYNEWLEEMDNFFDESNRILVKGGTLLVFMSIIKVESLIALAEKNGFYYKTTGIWHKTNPMPRNMNLHFVNSTEAWVYFIKGANTGTFNNNGKLIHDFIETSLTTKNEKKYGKHPTQKPIKLIDKLVSLLSNENDIVVDPFMGSGTTGVSCKKLNRKFIGIEQNSEYIEIAKQRILEVN